MSFSGIQGQARAVSLLQADLAAGRVADTYLFTGIPGTPKSALALEFAKALNCQNAARGRPDACDRCPACRKIGARNHADVFTLNFESQAQLLSLKEEEKSKQKEFRIEAIRVLISQSVLSPLEGRIKVFILEGAELLSEESANALLKVLEESSQKARWVLLATSLERVIPTIRSRSRRVPLSPALLEEDAGSDDPFEEAARQIQEIFAGGRRERNPLALSAALFADKKRGNQRVQAEQILKALARRLSERLREQADPLLAEALAWVFEAQQDLRRNVSPQLVMDQLLLSFAAQPAALRS